MDRPRTEVEASGSDLATSGWRPTNTAPTNGKMIRVRTVETYRYKLYKPEGARQMGSKGRWQIATEYGWANAPLPSGAEWEPVVVTVAGSSAPTDPSQAPGTTP